MVLVWSDIGLPAQEGGALTGVAGAGRGRDSEGSVCVVAQVCLPLTGHLAVAAVELVL